MYCIVDEYLYNGAHQLTNNRLFKMVRIYLKKYQFPLTMLITLFGFPLLAVLGG